MAASLGARSVVRPIVALATLVTLAVHSPPASARTASPTTTLVSLSSQGTQGNSESVCDLSNVSADGRYVEFRSGASNLVPGDTNGLEDVFVHDTMSGRTVRANVSTAGEQANGDTFGAALSGNGRYVAMESLATDLAPDANPYEDIFVRDLVNRTTVLADLSSTGEQANDIAIWAAISATGRYVAFASLATNLVPGVGNGQFQIFLRDRLAGTTALASASSSGEQGNDDSYAPSVSADGRYLGYFSMATNLVPGDTNGVPDIFVRDLVTGTTERASVSSNGVQANGQSVVPHLSTDGRYVAYTSLATNLVPGDTNGFEDGFVGDRLTGTTTRVTVSSAGQQGIADSVVTSISPDGGFIGVYSQATNLVPHDTNAVGDAFVYGLASRRMRLVSLSDSGRQGNGDSGPCGLSRGGTYAFIDSYATNLVPGDDNGYFDVFVRGPFRI